ncbi:MAG TPA: glycosyltransferase family 2 protein [Solirubrobacterales bacterium]|nr:glycosyltransferase family 2 protein [Solirubrobacterales bacterium]
MSARELGLLSVVAPVLDEEETLTAFYDRTCSALGGLDFELVLVDDGSGDRTPEILEDLASSDPRVHVVSLSRNFGFQAAVTAGLDHAAGDAVVTIDADLQDPPELIPKLIDQWRQGSDVVYAVRQQREGESRIKLTTSRWFERLFTRLAGLEVQPGVGDFRLLDRRVVDALGAMPERARFMRGMTVWVGYTQSSVPYRRDPRFAGQTSYSWRTLFRISLDALSSFSHAPLQVATVLGFVVSFFAFLGIPYVVINRLLGFYVEGVSTLLFAVLMLGGIQLITLGVIGEYISRIYDEVKRRPLYVVRERLNVAPPAATLDRADELTASEARR